MTVLTKLRSSRPLVVRRLPGTPRRTARLTICWLVKFINVRGLVRATLFRTVKSVAILFAAGLAKMIVQSSLVRLRVVIVPSTPVTRTKERTFLRTWVLLDVAITTIGSWRRAVRLNSCATPLLVIAFKDFTTKFGLTTFKVVRRLLTSVTLAKMVLPSRAPPRVPPSPLRQFGKVNGLPARRLTLSLLNLLAS